jgi:hypothetical protein
MEDIFEELHYEFINSEGFIQYLIDLENIYSEKFVD